MKKLSVCLLMCLLSCVQEIELSPQQEFNLTIYNASQSASSDALVASMDVSDDFSVGFFGDGSTINQFIVNDIEKGKSAVVILDEQKEPAFIYSFNPETLEKENAVVEFESIDPTKVLVRMYHYDWEKRIGTLITELEFIKQSSSWTSKVNFVTNNPDLTGVNERSHLKGGSYQLPITRFDALLARKSVAMGNMDLVGGFVDFIDNFRQNEIPRFLRENVTPLGDIATIVGAVGVLTVGSPALGVVFLGGVAISAGTRAISFVQSGNFERFIDNMRNLSSNVSDGIQTIRGNTVEIVSNLNSRVGDRWRQISDRFNDIDLTSYLNQLREQDILVDYTELDELPDARGVVQIGMRWNTNGTDIDLWVTDPSGERIFYQNPQSASGGFLDRDNTSGFGPENIYWRNGAPDGTYRVQVHYFGCSSTCPSTQFFVSVSNGLGTVKNYSGQLLRVDQVVTVVTFRKSGQELIFD